MTSQLAQLPLYASVIGQSIMDTMMYGFKHEGAIRRDSRAWKCDTTQLQRMSVHNLAHAPLMEEQDCLVQAGCVGSILSLCGIMHCL